MRVTLWLVLFFSILSTCLKRRKEALVRFLKVAGNFTYVCATVSESGLGDVRDSKRLDVIQQGTTSSVYLRQSLIPSSIQFYLEEEAVSK